MITPFLLLTGLLFFLLGGLALALPWHGVVALVEFLSAKQRLGATAYASLLAAPVVILLAFVFVLLGPWESEVCRSLQDACLEQVTHWTLPTWVGLGLGAACLLVGGRAIKPYLVRTRPPFEHAALPMDLAPKWEMISAEVERLCGMKVPPLQVLASPRSACFLVGPLRTRLFLSEAVLRSLEPDELVGAVAHELAHQRRGDLWWGPMAFLCYCLLFFMPVSHRCYSGYLAARERAADDWAIAHTGRPLALAAALGKVRRLAIADLPEATGGQLLAGRLHRLLAGASTGQPRLRAASFGYAFALVLIALPWLTPAIAELHHTLEPIGREVLTVLGIVS